MRDFKIALGLLLVFSVSCSHHRNTVKNILPRQSFVKIQKIIEATMCHPKKKDMCVTKRFGGTASGAVVNVTGNGAYVLTAAHVCIDEKAKKFLSKVQHKMFFYVINIESTYFPVEIIATDQQNKCQSRQPARPADGLRINHSQTGNSLSCRRARKPKE